MHLLGLQRAILTIFVLHLLWGITPGDLPAKQAVSNEPIAQNGLTERRILSPFWPEAIHEWSSLIIPVANTYGLDPDFVAAVVKAESNGVNNAVSRVGAVGLMGIMPSGPGMEWRPSTEELANPGLNLDWGVAILSEIVRDAGGDLYAALAAYSAGWTYVNHRVPQEYAADVLDDYGRAVAARNGISPEIAAWWTIAVEIGRGHIPSGASTLILGQRPVSGLFKYGEHIVYSDADGQGRAFYITGYAVPLALKVPQAEALPRYSSGDSLEPILLDRLERATNKTPHNEERVLLACLPSLSRLRGRASTRWFAPSFCPSWHR